MKEDPLAWGTTPGSGGRGCEGRAQSAGGKSESERSGLVGASPTSW